MKERLRSLIKVPAVVGIVAALVLVGFGTAIVYAETYPGGEDNGRTSRLKELSGDLTTLGYGSTSNSPDWGADWNLISTSAKWQPDGNITTSDVAAGKAFYNDSRTEQTGIGVIRGPVGICPTQAWLDGHANANQTDNCVSTWEVADPAVVGDDKVNPTSGLVWSRCLQITGGATGFSINNSCSSYSWDASATSNAGRTAKELCSDRGNGWRLPTQKELMQAYIDGAYYNLVGATTSQYGLSATEFSTTHIWGILFPGGTTTTLTKSSGSPIMRCVR